MDVAEQFERCGKGMMRILVKVDEQVRWCHGHHQVPFEWKSPDDTSFRGSGDEEAEVAKQ